jgi:tRNA(His) 5'-end guanylyltransferase
MYSQSYEATGKTKDLRSTKRSKTGTDSEDKHDILLSKSGLQNFINATNEPPTQEMAKDALKDIHVTSSQSPNTFSG